MSDAERKPGKRTGRPPKNPLLGKRINMMFRLNEARRDQLLEAGHAVGRSMSEEIEWRIEESFREQEKYCLTLSLLNNSPKLQRLISQISSVVTSLENLQDRDGKILGSRDWDNHEPTRTAVSVAVLDLLADATGPVREPDGTETMDRIKHIVEAAGGEALSEDSKAELLRLHEEMAIATAAMWGHALAAIATGKVRLDTLLGTLGQNR